MYSRLGQKRGKGRAERRRNQSQVEGTGEKGRREMNRKAKPSSSRVDDRNKRIELCPDWGRF